MGVKVYGLDGPHLNSTKNEISWDNIAGYDQQKRYALLSVTYFCSSLAKYFSYIQLCIDYWQERKQWKETNDQKMQTPQGVNKKTTNENISMEKKWRNPNLNKGHMKKNKQRAWKENTMTKP